MRQLTIRGFDERLERRLRRLAESHGISLNKAALVLMRRGAGLDRPAETADGVGDVLDGFVGVWSADEEAEFLRSVESLDQIDPELWW